MASRDNNRIVPIMGIDPNGIAAPVKIDNATGYVLMAITPASSTSPTVTKGKRDNNFVMSKLAIDTNGAFTPLLTDTRSDLLWITTT